MTGEDEIWLALSSLRASHRDIGCQRVECAIASLCDEDLEEILRAISSDDPLRAEIAAVHPLLRAAGATLPIPHAAPGDSTAAIAAGIGWEFPADAVVDESEDLEPRFEIGDRVVYDPAAQVNLELGGEYTGLGICTVTELDEAAHGQLLAFVDQRGDLHDGWWASRFRAADAEDTIDSGEGGVSYVVAYWSAAGYGCRMLAPRPKIVTAADVMAMTALLAADVGGDVVPLNWIELPLGLPASAGTRPVAPGSRDSSSATWSTLAPVRIGRADDDRLASISAPPAGRSSRTDPVHSGALAEHHDVPYLPRRAM